jgi:hypothetical protein
MRGGRWRRVTMAGGGSSRKGAIDGGSGFTSGGVGVPPAFGRGQEAGGGAKWCSWCACEGGREGGERCG